MQLTSQAFGMSPEGKNATQWTIKHDSGLTLSLSDWGATITSVIQADKNGQLAPVVLGFEKAEDYARDKAYLGATCGRFANRIAGGKFALDSADYQLECNDGEHHLHGGSRGFHQRLWDSQPFLEKEQIGVKFSYLSQEGEEGYPGRLEVQACYALHKEGRLLMDFYAETNAATIINITNHAYWNLAGVGTSLATEQELMLSASRYLTVDEGQIPTGNFQDVSSSPFDFRTKKNITQDANTRKGGYDHCWVLDNFSGGLIVAALLKDPRSGRGFVMRTNRPGLQFYTGDSLGKGKHWGGGIFTQQTGICLEPQDFPDAPNHSHFPSTVLLPGERYHHRSTVDFFAQ